MSWYAVYKTFRGGRYPKDGFDYIQADEDCVKKEAEYWADRTSGGHNYGYTIYWDKVNKPPEEWIINKIERLKNSKRDLCTTIKRFEEML